MCVCVCLLVFLIILLFLFLFLSRFCFLFHFVFFLFTLPFSLSLSLTLFYYPFKSHFFRPFSLTLWLLPHLCLLHSNLPLSLIPSYTLACMEGLHSISVYKHRVLTAWGKCEYYFVLYSLNSFFFFYLDFLFISTTSSFISNLDFSV